MKLEQFKQSLKKIFELQGINISDENFKNEYGINPFRKNYRENSENWDNELKDLLEKFSVFVEETSNNIDNNDFSSAEKSLFYSILLTNELTNFFRSLEDDMRLLLSERERMNDFHFNNEEVVVNKEDLQARHWNVMDMYGKPRMIVNLDGELNEQRSIIWATFPSHYDLIQSIYKSFSVGLPSNVYKIFVRSEYEDDLLKIIFVFDNEITNEDNENINHLMEKINEEIYSINVSPSIIFIPEDDIVETDGYDCIYLRKKV
ncbi:MAG: hypothetical protein J5680_01385, partial [Neisseriaceae bacterium]|nr:hypothetical protein [Neisseriaceae bacterium]